MQAISHTTARLLKLSTYFFFTACYESSSQTLLNSTDLGTALQKKIARVITHYHSPYSYDACDYKTKGSHLNSATCLGHLKKAMCDNHVDFLFLSDHPENMQYYEMSDLLLYEAGDELIYENGTPYANRIAYCKNGFKPTILVGFESKLMGLGLKNHISSDIEVRKTKYAAEDLATRNELQATTDALVFIPHTESRSVDLIESLNPDGIEIYNIHANVDPKIRKKDLKISPFEHLAGILTHLIDPYRTLNADFMFLHFFDIPSVYFKTWNQLIARGLKIAGIPGTDSHENIFPQKASDNERIDSHRRMTRFVSNYVITNNLEVASVKQALKTGSSWVVFEGFGTPTQMQFHINNTSQCGTTVTLAQPLLAQLTIPSLHPSSPQKNDAPEIRGSIKHIDTNGREKILLEGSQPNTTLTVPVYEPGAIRAEIMIRPKHLASFLGDFAFLSQKEFYWVITNHIYINP